MASLYGREYLGALDHLHRYFDYAGSRGGPVSPNDEKGARGVVQYAALNLACLHARFGHARLASCALDEAVRVAQQRHDHACHVTLAALIREAEYEADMCDPASRVEADRHASSLFDEAGDLRVVHAEAAAAR